MSSDKEEDREPRSDRRASEHLRHGVRIERDPGPHNERQREYEDEAEGAEQQESCCGGVTRDGAVGARFPPQCDQGDGGTRQSHREGQQEEVLWSGEQDQSGEQRHEGGEEEQGRDEAFCAGGDPEVPNPRAPAHEEHVTGHGRSSEQLQSQVEKTAREAGLNESDEGV